VPTDELLQRALAGERNPTEARTNARMHALQNSADFGVFWVCFCCAPPERGCGVAG
jgi:hypothetical protein